jgi:hypothetical protein
MVGRRSKRAGPNPTLKKAIAILKLGGIEGSVMKVQIEEETDTNVRPTSKSHWPWAHLRNGEWVSLT